MNYELFQSAETGTITCTVGVLGTVPSNPLKWIPPSTPVMSSLRLCTCPKVRCWILHVNPTQNFLSDTLTLVLQDSIQTLAAFSSRPSASLPQLRGSVGLCLGSPFLPHSLEALSNQHAGVVKRTHLVFHFSEIIVLHYLMSNVLQTIVSNTFLSI